MSNSQKFPTFVVLVVSILAILCSGCVYYQPPQVYNYDKEKIFPKPYDEVWQKAIEWFGTKGTPVKNLDKASGFISTEYQLSTDDLDSKSLNYLCDCGKSGYSGIIGSVIENANGNFNIIVTKVDEQNTKVIINTFYKADLYSRAAGEASETYQRKINCNSTGHLEKEFMNYLGK